MSNIEAALLAVLWTAVLAGLWGWRHWHLYQRRIPLASFGPGQVTEALRYEQQDQRQAILARGWLTQYEWLEIRRRAVAAVEAEIQRRGVDPNNIN